MGRLTLKGYIKSYVTEMSYARTNSILKLIDELDCNPRLREPLILYACLTQMPKTVEKKHPEFYDEYQYIAKNCTTV